jgi:hypothetical protein
MSNTSSNIFKNDNRNYRENRFRPQQSSNYPSQQQSGNLPNLTQNPFYDNRPRNQYSEFRPQNQRNQFNGSVINQQVAAPPPPRPVVPPIEEFPSLLRSPKVAPVAAVAPIQFAKVAKDAAHIVVQKPKLTQVKPEQPHVVVHQEVSTRIRMTLDEYRERKEDGEDLDTDNISFCSEYSNHADDSDDDI